MANPPPDTDHGTWNSHEVDFATLAQRSVVLYEHLMNDEGAHPRWGIEFDWLAVDLSGVLAVLTSAGYGPVPKAVRDHVESVDAALDLVNTRPYVGGSSSRPRKTGDYTDWREFAARGFYAYDWKVWSGPYVRLAVPTVPLTVDNLTDEWLRQIAMLARFTVDFASATHLNLADLDGEIT